MFVCVLLLAIWKDTSDFRIPVAPDDCPTTDVPAGITTLELTSAITRNTESDCTVTRECGMIVSVGT